jgi:nucleoside-diphosphate-sugar epimerase
VIPAIGDVFDPSTWGSHLADADAVISVASGNLAEDGPKLFKAVESAAKTLRPQGAPKLVFVATSGMWVYGDNRKTFRTEASPLDFDKMPLVAKWRPGLEQLVVKSDVVNGIVVRSSMCYGRAGSLWAMLFSQADKGEISWMGSPGGAYATVHVDDLAELYLLTVEKVRTCVPMLTVPTHFSVESSRSGPHHQRQQ